MTLRLLIASDLHVDHVENQQRVAALAQAWGGSDADALVLAGDISHRLDQLEATLRSFSGFQGPKLFVAGNHDIWLASKRSGPFADSWEKLAAINEVARRNRFLPLEEGNVEVGGFTFVGSILWYDYSYSAAWLGPREYASKQWGEAKWMDAEYAHWGMDDAAVTARLAAGVEERLARARNPVIFVSHHLPLERFVIRRGTERWDFFNAYMGSRRFEDAFERAGVARFIFGHNHLPLDLDGDGLRAVNNPVGYPRERLQPVSTPFLFR